MGTQRFSAELLRLFESLEHPQEQVADNLQRETANYGGADNDEKGKEVFHGWHRGFG